MELTNKQKGIIQDFQELMLELGGKGLEYIYATIHLKDDELWFSGFTMAKDGEMVRNGTLPGSDLVGAVQEVMEEINAQ